MDLNETCMRSSWVFLMEKFNRVSAIPLQPCSIQDEFNRSVIYPVTLVAAHHNLNSSALSLISSHKKVTFAAPRDA